MTDAAPSAAELRLARLVDHGMPYEQATRLAPHLGGSTASAPSAGASAMPAGLAAAAGDPANTDQLEAAAAGGDDSPGRRFISLTTDALAALPDREFRAGLASAKQEGLL